MFLLFIYFILIFYTGTSSALEFVSKENPANLEIIPQKGSFVIDEEHFFGIKLKLAKGWKTYWKNPGDSGAPLNLELEKNDGSQKFEILYPFPKKFTEKGLRTIGYEEKIIFPVRFNPEDLNSSKQKIKIDYLVCKDICIPVTSSKVLELGSEKVESSKEFIQSFETVPKKQSKIFTINQFDISEKDGLVIKITNQNKKDELKVFGFSEETNIKVDENFKKSRSLYKIISDQDIESLKKPLHISISDGNAFEEIVFWPKNSNKQSLFYFITLAILGGIILNFMPCVLPVLSLKLYHFSSIQNSNPKKIRSNCFYIILGIFFSFLCLALSVIFFKLFGETVGWGFQFQNTYFLFIITFIIFLFSLNLLGFFEIILPNSLNNKINKFLGSKGEINQFLSGAFATLLATPCSAPFLGTAVGFSMLAANFEVIIIFLSISFGFSVPYFLCFIFPNIINFFPKPGNWMINFKYFLGFLLFLSAIWMMTLIKIDEKLIFLFSTVILYFSYIRGKNTFKKLIFFSFLISSIYILLNNKYSNEKILWHDFDKEFLEKNLKNDEFIIVDVTADWCVTCQVNKITTFSSNKFLNFTRKNNIVTIRADWTQKDTKILEYIKNFGRFGIPVNVIYGPDNKDGILLPEIISNDIVVSEFFKVGVK